MSRILCTESRFQIRQNNKLQRICDMKRLRIEMGELVAKCCQFFPLNFMTQKKWTA